jgi:phytoene synthase
MPRAFSECDHATAADLAACRELLRQGSRTFHAASLLLPDRVRGPAASLYAFCRLADDAIDLHQGRLDALPRLLLRLTRAYAGRPLPHPVDRAFADMAAHHAVPEALPLALFEGFAWDAEGRRYQTLEDLQAYAARVAGTVGAMMAVLMGVRAPSLLARACDLGVAMQLTNIARDVGEDARAGRLYLPLQWLHEERIEPDAWLARPRFTPALGAVVQRLLRAADRLYARSDAGIEGLPADCRPAIRAARLLYAGIGRELEQAGLDSVARRAVVPYSRKLVLLAQARRAGAAVPSDLDVPPLPQTRFLVEAVTASPVGLRPAPTRWWEVGRRAVWVVELFARLERQHRLERAG